MIVWFVDADAGASPGGLASVEILMTDVIQCVIGIGGLPWGSGVKAPFSHRAVLDGSGGRPGAVCEHWLMGCSENYTGFVDPF